MGGLSVGQELDNIGLELLLGQNTVLVKPVLEGGRELLVGQFLSLNGSL